MRKPSIKKSISARTTGRAKRAVKKAVIPGYGKKGMGWVKNPKKAAYNKVYNKTTFGVNDVIRAAAGSNKKRSTYSKPKYANKPISKSESQVNNKLYVISQTESIGNKIGVSNNLIKKAPKYIIGAIILIFLGISIPILLLPGLILDIIGLKILFSKEYKKQNIWKKSLMCFVENKYVDAQNQINKLSDEEKDKHQYKVFMNMINNAVNPVKERKIEYSNEVFDEFIAIDIETTGLDSSLDRIIEISAVKFKNGQIVDEFEELIDPERNITKEITAINNITNEMVKGKPHIEQVLNRLLLFIEDKPLIAHNATFDIKFINSNLSFMGKTIDNKVIDTLRISRKIYDNLQNHKLKTIKEYLNIDGVSHRAKNDAVVAGRIYIDYCKIKRDAEAQFNEEERKYFNIVKEFLKSKGRDISYLKLRHVGNYTDICAFYTLLRFKVTGKKRYILTNIDNNLLEGLGIEIEPPSKSERYNNRISLECFEKFNVLEEYILNEYDKCIGEIRSYVDNTKTGEKALDDYLLS